MSDLGRTSPTPVPARRARLGRGLALALSAALVALLVLELAVRLLLAPPAVNGKLVADEELGFRMPSGFAATAEDERGRVHPYRLNSLGFRGPEWPADGAALEGERVLVLGDSFVTAWGVRDEDWVGTVVGTELAARGIANHVFSAGSDDYGTAQELLLLRRHAARLRPTTVMLLVYSGNDLVNNTRELAGRTNVSPGDYFRPYLEPDERGDLALTHALPVTAWLRHSRLFTLAEATWLTHQEPLALNARLLPDVVHAATSPELTLASARLGVLRPPEPDSAWAAAWRATEALIRAVRDETRRDGARFVVAVIPDILQVEDGHAALVMDQELARAGLPPARELVDWNLPEREFERFFHAEGMDHALILEPLRAATRTDRRAPYQRANGHLDDVGHALLARALVQAWTHEASACFAPDGASGPVAVGARARLLESAEHR